MSLSFQNTTWNPGVRNGVSVEPTLPVSSSTLGSAFDGGRAPHVGRPTNWFKQNEWAMGRKEVFDGQNASCGTLAWNRNESWHSKTDSYMRSAAGCLANLAVDSGRRFGARYRVLLRANPQQNCGFGGSVLDDSERALGEMFPRKNPAATPVLLESTRRHRQRLGESVTVLTCANRAECMAL